MADQKISELTAASDVTGAEFSGIQSTTNKRFASTLLVAEGDSRLTDARTPLSHGNEAHDSTFITSAGAPVQSVNTQTGIVSLAKGDVGLGNVDNTSDTSKPVSTATQTALDAKADETDVLTRTNTDVYTPSADYHPATKKYVDDNSGGSSYTPDVFFAELNASFSSATSWADVPWAAASRSNGSYTHTATSADITLAAGDYEVHTKVIGTATGGNRVQYDTQILLDDVQQSLNNNYAQRNSTQNKGGVNDFVILVGVTANQVLTVQQKHVGSSSTVDNCSIFIRKLAT